MLWLLRHVYSNKRCFKMQDLFMYFYQDNSDLWIVLHVWVRKKIRKNIYKNTGWQHEHFLNAFFTNSQRPVVDCLTVAAGILARSEEVIKGTGADQRFVKNALKICVLPPIYYKYLFLSYFYLIQRNAIQITTGCVC